MQTRARRVAFVRRGVLRASYERAPAAAVVLGILALLVGGAGCATSPTGRSQLT